MVRKEGEVTFELFAKLRSEWSREVLVGRLRRKSGREAIGIERKDEVGVGWWTRGCEWARLVRSKDLERRLVATLLDGDEVFEGLVGLGRLRGWRWRWGCWM